MIYQLIKAVRKIQLAGYIAHIFCLRCSGKIEVVSVAPMIAEAIKRNYTGASLSKRFYDCGNPAVTMV